MPHRLTTHRDLPEEAGLLNFRDLVDNMVSPYMIMDRDLVIVYANRAYEKNVERSLDEMAGRYVFDVFPDEAEKVAKVRDIFLDTLNGHPTYLERLYFHLDLPDGTSTTKCWQATQSPYFDETGKVIYIVQHSHDFTEQDALERKNQIIAQELDHRVKNIFSVIQAIASLASQRADNVAQFREDFAARIVSMSRAYNSLSRGNWEGMDLRSVVDAELEQFGGAANSQVHVQGPKVTFKARIAQNASMFFHELATNAAKYGALSRPEGRLDIQWYREPGGAGLHIIWDESGLSGITEPTRTGFGTQLTSFLAEMNVTREYRDCGLRIECYMPLDAANVTAA